VVRHQLLEQVLLAEAEAEPGPLVAVLVLAILVVLVADQLVIKLVFLELVQRGKVITAETAAVL
jgi:hypothetical protein